MKLGTQTASVHNHLMSRAVIGQPTPTVGMGATILCWTDRHGATIVDVRTARNATFIVVQEDTAIRTDRNGMSECQQWTHTPNQNGSQHTFRRTTDSGVWQEVRYNEATNRWNKTDGHGLRIGERAEYHDFSF